ncbi:MAG: hypothetical protein WA908_01515 [Pontixanthobacter sp.]
MSEGIKIGSRHLEPSVRLPKLPEYYLLSDDEVHLLGSMTRNIYLEIFWASTGLFFGFLYPAVAALFTYQTTGGFSLSGMISIAIAMFTLGISVTTGRIGFAKQTPAEKLLADILDRPLVKIDPILDLDFRT